MMLDIIFTILNLRLNQSKPLDIISNVRYNKLQSSINITSQNLSRTWSWPIWEDVWSWLYIFVFLLSFNRHEVPCSLTWHQTPNVFLSRSRQPPDTSSSYFFFSLLSILLIFSFLFSFSFFLPKPHTPPQEKEKSCTLKI